MINNSIITGTKLPELTNPASKMDIAYGKQVIDANGDVITGSINEQHSGNTYLPLPPTTQVVGTSVGFVTNAANNFHAVDCICRSDNFVRSGAIVRIPIIPSTLGNATAADVAAGKTFTSSQGFAVTGTATKTKNSYTISINQNQIHIAFSITYTNTSGNLITTLTDRYQSKTIVKDALLNSWFCINCSSGSVYSNTNLRTVSGSRICVPTLNATNVSFAIAV